MPHARTPAVLLVAVALAVTAATMAHPAAAAAAPDLAGQPVSALATFDGSIYAGTGSGLQGLRNTGWTNPAGPLQDEDVNALVVSGGALFAGTPHGVFRTGDGSDWAAAGLGGSDVNALAADGVSIVAGTGTSDTDGMVFRSDDGGSGWQPAIGPPLAEGLPGEKVQAVLAPLNDGPAWAATAGGGSYVSATATGGWSNRSSGLSDTWVASLWRSPGGDGRLLAGTDAGLDEWSGSSWSAVTLPGTNPWVQALGTTAGGAPIAGTYDGTVDVGAGAGWTQLASGLPSVLSVLADPAGGTLVGTVGGLYCAGCPAGGASVPATSASAPTPAAAGTTARGLPAATSRPPSQPATPPPAGPVAAATGAGRGGLGDAGSSGAPGDGPGTTPWQGLLGVVLAALAVGAIAATVGWARRRPGHDAGPAP